MDRFWSKVEKAGPNECWRWTAACDPNGYGAFKLLGKKVGAHVVSHELMSGAVPPGKEVMHSCDNRSCVNPAHLSAGTRLQNVQDMDAKGRRNWAPVRGSLHGSAKTTEIEVRSMRDDHAEGKATTRQLAKRHGLTGRQIRRILSRKSWAHI